MALTIQTLDQTQLYMSDDMLGNSIGEDAPVLDKLATEKQVGFNLNTSISGRLVKKTSKKIRFKNNKSRIFYCSLIYQHKKF